LLNNFADSSIGRGEKETLAISSERRVGDAISEVVDNFISENYSISNSPNGQREETMSEILTKKIELEVDSCCVCGVIHAIPKQMRDHYYNFGGRWYCPNGHHIGWNAKDSKSRADKLESEIARLNSSLVYKNELLEIERRRTAAAKGETTKLKNRIANGVCPCCRRSFANLHRHINKQHPNFKE
jgi:hypothetical protein